MKATRLYPDSHRWHHPCRDCSATIVSAIGKDGEPLNLQSDEGPLCSYCWHKPRRNRARWHGWAILRAATLAGGTSAEV
jgi:hypothetical protein